jgi:hypothetical protein
MKDGSAPFLLYNSTRFHSIFTKFENGVSEGIYPPLPPIGDIDWTLLTDQYEWELLLDCILHFPQLLQYIACPAIPTFPGNPEFPIHLVGEFCCHSNTTAALRLFSVIRKTVQ